MSVPNVFCSGILIELRQFLNKPTLEYKSRQEAANAVAAYYKKLSPCTREDLDYFYDTCDDYVYENCYCNKEASCASRIKKTEKILKENNFKTLLEIGAGPGTYALSFEKMGYFVDALQGKDLAAKFFAWRIKRHNSHIHMVQSIEGKYDCILFFDVIEHVFDPYEFLKEIAEHTDAIIFTHGFGVHRKDMGGYPQHFDHKINDIKSFLESIGFEKQKVKEVFPPHFYKRKIKKED